MTAEMLQRHDSTLTESSTVSNSNATPEQERLPSEEEQQSSSEAERAVGIQLLTLQTARSDDTRTDTVEDERESKTVPLQIMTTDESPAAATLPFVQVDVDATGHLSNDANNETSDLPSPPPPPSLPLQQCSESRDVSSAADSRNSRESLRLEVSRRRHMLTASEFEFLERLTVEGTNIEVELAMQTLADEDLFFDYSTPRHLKFNFNPFAEDKVDRNSNNRSLSANSMEDIASISERMNHLLVQEHPTDTDGAVVLSDAFNDMMVETRGSMGAAILTEDECTRDGAASTVTGMAASRKSSASFHSQGVHSGGGATRASANAVASGRTNRRDIECPDPPIPSDIPIMIGSKKRMEVLERRRSSAGINLGKIWKAHETGLAVTTVGSRKSLLRRQTSVGSAISAISGLTGPAPSQLDIFRIRGKADAASIVGIPVPVAAHLSPPMPSRPIRRPVYGRSNSVTFGMMRKPYGGRLRYGRPKIPEPGGMHRRRSSASSRKSVTFHHVDEEFEFDDKFLEDDPAEEKKMPATADLPKRSKMLRRTMSDSMQYEYPPQKQSEEELTQLAEEEETGSDDQELQGKEDIHRQSQVSSTSTLTKSSTERQDSVPRIRHAHPIRQDSISSIPSIHHARPIRQDSISSIPSLHGHRSRQESIQSIPSLHLGLPLRDESMNSIPSLHHGVHTRSNSIQSVPSLHHGHPLQSSDDLLDDLSRSTTRKQLLQPFSALEDIAAAWLQQRQGRLSDGCNSVTSLESLPHDVTVPLVDTEPTVANTSVDDLSVLSPSAEPEDPQTALHGLPNQKPILMRIASENIYEGEGIEVTQLDNDPLEGNAPRNISVFSMDASLRTVTSFDDLSMYSTSHRRTSGIFRTIRRTNSDESMSTLYLGHGRDLLSKLPGDVSGQETVGTTYGEDFSEADASWDMQSELSGRFDAWGVLQDDYVNGYGGGGTLGFSILGTSASDESAQPHVLSPPLMESLQAFMPYSLMGQNFYLRYSMVRDGASLPALLKRARGIKYSIIAVETVDGEVFGSFTGQAWRKNWNYFGTGESFLWKMRRSRLEKSHDILEQAQKESEIEVYPYTGENRFIQLCTHDRLAVGGGLPSSAGDKKMSDNSMNDHDFGFGLAIQSDLLQGTTSPCLTFGSPSLSNAHADGSMFEIINIELWTLTPCATVEEAEKLELGKLFLQLEPNSALPYEK